MCTMMKKYKLDAPMWCALESNVKKSDGKKSLNRIKKPAPKAGFSSLDY